MSIKLLKRPLPKVNIKRNNLDFANFSAATAMHTSSGEDWRLRTSVNLAAEERLWIDQSGTLATKVTESRQSRGTAAVSEPVLTNWRLLR